MKKLFIVFFLGAAFLLQSCLPEHDELDEPQVDQSSFLSNTASIIQADYIDFNLAVNQLNEAIDSLVDHPTPSTINIAQASLKNAYLSWQNVSIFEFGPAENEALKSNVNVYKTDTIQINNNISSGTYELDQISMKDAKGFPALDFLLNSKSDSNTIMLLQSSINYGLYTKAVMQNLKQKANKVVSDWSNYTSTYTAQTGTDVGSSTGLLVNALNQHYEVFFRDNKIGIPLGIRSSGIARPDFVEGIYGEYSLDLAIANFKAMRNIYNGGNGYGLDDYLSSSNAAELNNTIQTQLEIIDLKLKALSSPLPYQINSNPAPVQGLYNAMQQLIILWKVDMPSRMGVLISYQDNDGD